MILDKKLSATLDQDTHCLSLIEEKEDSLLFDRSLGILSGLGHVLDGLAVKASLLKWVVMHFTSLLIHLFFISFNHTYSTFI